MLSFMMTSSDKALMLKELKFCHYSFTTKCHKVLKLYVKGLVIFNPVVGGWSRGEGVKKKNWGDPRYVSILL